MPQPAATVNRSHPAGTTPGMREVDVNDAIREAERQAHLAGAGPTTAPNPSVPPAVHAQLAHAWALVAVARALTLHADHPPRP